ncbi:pre-16S rRNA-processing nuclease YqgF [Candidatus Kaiserbacteria bacterium]|nr:pre-16S rRNA-processing nuclease YqgF [Candidatus Kaiserbacteria bacterium]
MKYLAVDYGGKRVGVAISDATGSIAFPHGELPNDKELLPALARLIASEGIGLVVVGDTRAPGGMPNPVTEEAEAFIESLARASGKEVLRASEMWTSIEASRYAPKGHEHDNAAAAAVILQRFLDMKGTK